MPTLGIESNGTIEKTAVYYNGQQLGGLRELFLNLSEDGTFDSVIVYLGSDGNEYIKNPFSDYLDNLQFREPSFTEEEASNLQLVEIESDGDIENTSVYYNSNFLDGLVELFIHIKSPVQNKSKISSLFKSGKVNESSNFVANFTFRYEDGSIVTEGIF
jgi:hypothetical protein